MAQGKDTRHDPSRRPHSGLIGEDAPSRNVIDPWEKIGGTAAPRSTAGLIGAAEPTDFKGGPSVDWSSGLKDQDMAPSGQPLSSRGAPSERMPQGMRPQLVFPSQVNAMPDTELTPAELRQRQVFGTIRHGAEGEEQEDTRARSMDPGIREALAKNVHTYLMGKLMTDDIPIREAGVAKWPSGMGPAGGRPRPESPVTSRFDPDIVRVPVKPGDKKTGESAETRKPTAKELEKARNEFHASKDKEANAKPSTGKKK